MQKFNFQTVDTIGEEYELLALPFDGKNPQFSENAKNQIITNERLTVYRAI
jgi:hypothetical protein